MTHRIAITGGLVALLVVLSGGPASASAGHSSHRAGTLSSTARQFCDPATSFNQGNFSESTAISNRWLPLTPGTQFTLEGRANRGGGVLPHTVVLTVTDLTKVIDGVSTVVLWDRDIQDGELAEAELAFHAQDSAGRVWGLGEYPEEYENGEFVGAPSTWISGKADASGGVMMLAAPQLGTPAYLQGSARSVGFLDCAQVSQTGQHVCVPLTCYDNVLVIDEWSPLDPASGHQEKFYAPGVGNIKVTAIDDPEGETLVLTKVTHLNRRGLASARNAALTLEEHAYEVSKVYRSTAPMQ
jgi:hypothetical protein